MSLPLDRSGRPILCKPQDPKSQSIQMVFWSRVFYRRSQDNRNLVRLQLHRAIGSFSFLLGFLFCIEQLTQFLDLLWAQSRVRYKVG